EPAPEPWSPSMTRRLLIWGYGSWIWRAILFLGIALAVYHLFFKVLGIFLMVVELLWFIGLPIWRELGEWWQRREQADSRKVLITGLSLGALLLVLIVPWRSSVEIPAVLEASRTSALHAPVAARLKAVHVQDGQSVAAGDLLLELDSPDLDSRQAIVRRETEILQLQLRRQSARSETAADAGILEQRLAEAVAEYRGLAAQRERLQLRAAQAGVVRDLQRDLSADRWLHPGESLARIVEPGLRLRGYLAEENLWRIETGSEGRFIADDPARPAVKVRLDEVDATGVAYLELEALSSDHGGPIAVRRDAQRRAEPVQAQYGVRLTLLDNDIHPDHPLRGVVILDGERQSLLGAAWRRIAALGVRESGF
ncbi:biotin/lipoyl-binding protein, partial [Pseudomonas sp. OA3]|nr:biotin/lipoyl-binding protein [Pseudomonas sp. OA3]